jgi:hypothetical protein
MCGIAAPAAVGLSRPVWSELAVFVRFPNQIEGCGWWDGPGGQRRCPFALLLMVHPESCLLRSTMRSRT